MKQKTHMAVAGKLVRTDKQFRHLKQQQKENISLWLYETYRNLWMKMAVSHTRTAAEILLLRS